MKLGPGLGLNRRRKSGGGGGGGDTIPVITGVPTISGTATVGSVLTASPASVSGSPTPTRTWQWARNGVDIGGATSVTYTAVVADYGVTLTVRQIETNVAGTDDATSAGTVIAWEPAALFQASEAGFWGKVEIGKLWQDVARTTPVTAAGQEVLSWELSTASGVIYAEQATSGLGPLYQEDTGVGYLDFDGVDNFLVTPSVNFTGTDKITALVGLQKDSDSAVRIVLELSVRTNVNSGAFFISAPNDATTQRYGTIARGTTALVVGQGSYVTGTGTATDRAVITTLHDISGDSTIIRRNGSAFAAGTSDKGTGNFGNYPVYIGGRTTGSLYFDGRIYGLVVRGALTSGTDLTNVEAWADALINP